MTSATTVNVPLLQPHVVLGLNTEIPANAQYLSDEDIVYPVGSLVVVYNVNLKKQKYIKLANKGKNLTHVAISPNKKIIAVVESCDDKLPIITLWCPITFRKKRTLYLPTDLDIITTRYAAVGFTYDSKNLISVTDKPDWCLYSFQCDKGRFESRGKANNANNTGTVIDMACHPSDATQVAFVGDSVLRIMACNEFNWRQYGYSKTDQAVLTACCWLSQDRLMAGTSRGVILILESGELKLILEAENMQILEVKYTDEAQQSSKITLKTITSSSASITENREIRSIVSFARGFAFTYHDGQVHLFEKESTNKYTKRNVFVVPPIKKSSDEEEKTPEKPYNRINCISINPAFDRLLITCGVVQMYTLRLWVQEGSSEEMLLQEYGYSLHFGAIGSMAVCRWKPLILTAGATDCTLKLWNYESEELEMQQRFEDDVYGVALHPTGLYAVVGFTDKLRYMMVMVDEFISSWEFSIRSCKMVSYSCLGHLFAAADGNIIQVYSSINFNMLYSLRGHNGIVTGLSWTELDQTLASCGSDGAVYEWDVAKSTRTTEVIIKSTAFTGVCIDSRGKGSYAIGTDGHLRELFNSSVFRDVALVPKNVALDAMCLSKLNTMLFVAGNGGVIYSLKIPLQERVAEMMDFVVHSTPVTVMCMSFDDRLLFSASEDGTICYWRLLNIDDKQIIFDKDFDASNQILISKQILEEKVNQIKNLQLRMRELTTEHAYETRQIETEHEAVIEEIHAEYRNAIEELKEKNEQIESDQVQDTQNINLQIMKLKTDHDNLLQKTEANYNEKLIIEYQKYQNLDETLQKIRNNYETELMELREAKRKSEEDITNDFLEKIKNQDLQMDEFVEREQREHKEHEHIKQQIEDDADKEICELKIMHEKKFKQERDMNVKLRGQATATQKKLLAAQKTIDDLKHTVATLENEQIKFKYVIVNLEKEIADLKSEIQERDSTIEDKEKRIFQLKNKNQELEKFKFLLDYKIKELKDLIEPKLKVILEQQKQISEMVFELETLQKVILGLDLHVADLKDKLNASELEVKKEIERNVRMKNELKTIRGDIHHASEYIHNIPMLTKMVREMYHKYNADKDFVTAQAEDVEAKSEFLRQRNFLERTVLNLKQQAAKNTNLLSSDKGRLIDENVLLLVETNQLRKNLKEERKQNKKFQSLMGFTSGASNLPRIVQQKVEMATSTREEIHNQYKNAIMQQDKCMAALKDENARLIQNITKETEDTHNVNKDDPKPKAYVIKDSLTNEYVDNSNV